MGLFDSYDDIFNEEYKNLEKFSDIEGFDELFTILKDLRHDNSLLQALSDIRDTDTKAELHEVDIGKKNLSFILNAKKAFGFSFILNLPPLTKFVSYISFEAIHVLIEAIYVYLSDHRLTDQEYASIYLSDIGKQLTFNVFDFDKGLSLPDLDEIKFFKRLKNTYYADKRAKKLDKAVYGQFSSIDAEDYAETGKSTTGNFCRALYFSNIYLSACNALRGGRDKVSCEDIVVGYLTVFKLINYDIKSLIPLVDHWENE